MGFVESPSSIVRRNPFRVNTLQLGRKGRAIDTGREMRPLHVGVHKSRQHRQLLSDSEGDFSIWFEDNMLNTTWHGFPGFVAFGIEHYQAVTKGGSEIQKLHGVCRFF